MEMEVPAFTMGSKLADVLVVVVVFVVFVVTMRGSADCEVEGSLKELEMLSTFEGNEGEKDITHTRDCITADAVSILPLPLPLPLPLLFALPLAPLTLSTQAVQAERREQEWL